MYFVYLKRLRIVVVVVVVFVVAMFVSKDLFMCILIN